MASRFLLLMLVASAHAFAGTKIIKNDTFTGVGNVFSGLSFGEYQGAAVLFEPAQAEYPLTIVGVDILLVPYNNQSGAIAGLYEFDLWDESGGTVPPPVAADGGTYPGRISKQALRLTPTTTMFNRYTLPTPLVVPSGKIFVKVSQILDTASDGTTIAMDQTTSPKPNANWWFNGFGGFERMDLPDGGSFGGLNRNWIIRLVLEVPDVGVSVTSISPSSSLTTATTSVVIAGSGFELGARAFLGTNELALTNLTGTTVGATVPAGLPVGPYDVVVRNLSGVEGRLPNGYRVFEADGGMGGSGGGAGGGSGGGAAGGGTGGGAGGGTGGAGGGTASEALSLTAITPAQISAEEATSLFLTGTGFQAGARVLIGGTRVDGAVVESSGVISAALTSGLLTPGTYDVSVINLSGGQATLPQAFKVLAGSRAKPGCGCTNTDLLPALLAALLLVRRRR